MKNLPYAIFDHGVATGATVVPIVFATDVANFGRDAKRVEIWGDTGTASGNDVMTVHFNEAVKRKIPNPTGPDTTDYRIQEMPSIEVGPDFDQPYIFEAKDWGGSLTSIRISAMAGGANDCTIRIS